MALKNSYPNLFSFCTNPGDDNWSNHGWDISFRRFEWLEVDRLAQLLQEINSFKGTTPIPDTIIWKQVNDGKNSANWLQKKKGAARMWDRTMKQIWKSLAPTKVRCFSAPTKVKCFSWLVARKACLAQEILKRRGFQIVSRCFLCNEAEIWSLFLSLTNKMDNTRTCCRSVELMD